MCRPLMKRWHIICEPILRKKFGKRSISLFDIFCIYFKHFNMHALRFPTFLWFVGHLINSVLYSVMLFHRLLYNCYTIKWSISKILFLRSILEKDKLKSDFHYYVDYQSQLYVTHIGNRSLKIELFFNNIVGLQNK